MNTEPTHKLTVKIGDSLRTIQGYSLDEYVAARNGLIEQLAADAEAVAQAKAVTNAMPLINTAVQPPQAAPAAPAASAVPAPPTGWPQVPAPVPVTPAMQQATAPTEACMHGPLVYAEWVGGPNSKNPGKQYKAWRCSANDRACSNHTKFVH